MGEIEWKGDAGDIASRAIKWNSVKRPKIKPFRPEI